MKLTVIIPCFNEEKTIGKVLKKIQETTEPIRIKQIIVVDDGSTDKTSNILSNLKLKNIMIVRHRVNMGKGAAIASALKIASGDIVLIQDADLEYDPADWGELLQPIIDQRADVVFGSRFIGKGPHRVLYFWHQMANQAITLLSNIFTNLNLSDIETGSKAFTIEVARHLDLREKGFGFEPEFTAKVAKLKSKVFEVGVSYAGRTYEEGKKITWIEGFKAIYCIFKYNLL